MLHPRNPPNRATQLPRYKFKSNQNLALNVYSERPRNPRFSIGWISGMWVFHWKLSHRCMPSLNTLHHLSAIYSIHNSNIADSSFFSFAEKDDQQPYAVFCDALRREILQKPALSSLCMVHWVARWHFRMSTCMQKAPTSGMVAEMASHAKATVSLSSSRLIVVKNICITCMMLYIITHILYAYKYICISFKLAINNMTRI